MTVIARCAGIAGATAAIAMAGAAIAQDRVQPDPAAVGSASDDIIVAGRAANTSIIGSDVPLHVYPRSVRILDCAKIEALNPTRLGDLLDLAGGVARQNDFGGLWGKYSIRGFAGDENAGPDIQVNRFSSNYGFNAPYDVAALEWVRGSTCQMRRSA